MHIPPLSHRNTPKFSSAEHRRNSSAAFNQGASNYHDIRPGYPLIVQDFFRAYLPQHQLTIVDIGSGTGKLTANLIDLGTVIALDTSKDMLDELAKHTPAHRIRARAEATGLATGTIDAITCAQTWHWLDTNQTSHELARISTSDAPLLLVWNSLDVDIPWVHRLSRIMHSGDTLKRGFIPPHATPWEIVDILRDSWIQTLLPEDIHALTRTRSYWLRANNTTRARVNSNLNWYLYDHLGHTPETLIELPYRVDAFILRKA
ncbi:SAM-dependent methyltransferase [Corynebacterium kutscheri]|uniref:class I SAM-dependent methyltransferase n=1 Tax=Corynebacterium kutscheri TaxID=35755 RepID=UPI000F70F0B3|nr:class I SAM-dependent methyltransferase [Corynebacterium kutscheri]VEH79570.1 SAM-dependent methyltransferase [Corynebacterium kutscheri]